MLSPATILHFDSTYRNKQDWPFPGEFEVPVEGNSNYVNSQLNNLNAAYAVAGSSVSFYHKWGGGSFNLYSVANVRQDAKWSAADGATLTLTTTTTTLTNSEGNFEIFFDVSASDHPQMLKNYYRGVTITTNIGGTDYDGVVEQYEYLENRQCKFVVSGLGYTNAIPVGTSFSLTDPTDTASNVIFLPAGDRWNDAYNNDYIIFNDSLNEWRPIGDFDGNKSLVYVYVATDPLKAGQPASQSGLITNWENQHTYSIRHLNGVSPVVNDNGGAALIDPSPVSTTNNTALWFEPKQAKTNSAFNLGPNASLDIQKGSFLELMYNPGGTSTLSQVNYQDTLTGGSTTTAILAVGPNASWTQDDYYKGMSMVVDTVAVGQALTITQNTDKTTNFVADSHVVATGTNNTYSGTGTGMTFTLTVSATGTDDVVSAVLITAGSGYVAGETITIDQTQMRAITGVATLTILQDVILEITAAAATGDSQGLVRLVTAYNSATKTVTLDTALPATLASGDTVSFHPYANRSVVPSVQNYPAPGWRSKLVESNRVTDYINESGTFASTGTSGNTSLELNGARLKTNGAYNGFWLSWIHNDACYVRLITSSTYNETTGVTTVNFARALGGVVQTVTLTNPGTNYPLGNSPTTVDPTSPGGIGGSGLVMNVTATTAGPPGPVSTFSVADGGNHYSVGDRITLTAGDGNCTGLVTVLDPTAAVNGDPWYIHSGKTETAFSSFLNMQQWLVKNFVRNNVGTFTLSTSNVSLQEQVCYEVDLVSLTLPNAPLATSRSGRLAFYPYVFVELSSPGTSGGASRNLIMSNNPNALGATFVAPVDDVTHPEMATFIKVDGDGAAQYMKFNPNTNLKLKVTLPSGEIVKFQVTDEDPPAPPNSLGQLSAVFALKRVC